LPRLRPAGEPRIAAKVSKGNFNPPPKVDSAILVVENISKKNFADVSEVKFFEVVRAGFASKRKILAGNLAKKFGKEKVAMTFEKVGLKADIRAEKIPVHEWLRLARELFA